MKIYHLAAAQDKIRRFNITDPATISFVYNYENLIDWNKIKKDDLSETGVERQIWKQINEVLYPALLEKINPDSNDNYYLEKVNFMPEIQRAQTLVGGSEDEENIKLCYKVFHEQGASAAHNERLRYLNWNKQVGYEKWERLYKHTYVNKAFAYMIFKMGIETSKKNDKSPPIPIRKEIISVLNQKIENNEIPPQTKIGKTYQEAINEYNAKDIKPNPDDPSKGWIRVKSKLNDPERFDENLQKVIDFSTPNGWCTGYGYAKSYLEMGDFWFYIENKNAKIAVRFEDDSIIEIRGQRNETPYEYYNVIEKFMIENNFRTISDSYTKFIPLAKETNRIFEENIKDNIEPPLISISIEFQKYRELSKENKEKVSEKELKAIIENTSNKFQIAEFYNFDVNKIPSASVVINYVTSLKTGPKSGGDTSFGSAWSNWLPWRWCKGVNFNPTRIPEEIINVIADESNLNASLEYCKWCGFVTTKIPNEIIENIAKSQTKSFEYAKESLFHLPSIPDPIINSIAQNDNLFSEFAEKSGIDITKNLDNIMHIVVKSPILSAMAAEKYNYNPEEIPKEIWEAILSSPKGSLKFIELVQFNPEQIPEEILKKVSEDMSTSAKYVALCIENKKPANQSILSTVTQDVDTCMDIVKNLNYDFSNIPPSIYNTAFSTTQNAFELCKIKEFNFKSIPENILGKLSQMEDQTEIVNGIIINNIETNEIPETVINGIANHQRASYAFAETKAFDLTKIPKIIVEKISEDHELTKNLVIGAIANWKNKLQKERPDISVVTNFPEPIINQIASRSETSSEVADELGYNRMYIHPKIIQSIARDATSSYSFAKNVDYNFARIPSQILSTIENYPEKSLYFLKGVNYNIRKITTKMIQTIINYLKNNYHARYSHFFLRMMESVNFNISFLDQETQNVIMQLVTSRPDLCIIYANAKKGNINEIPKEIIQTITEHSSLSLQFANIVNYNVSKIPKEMIEKIASDPAHSYSYITSLNFNFKMIPTEIIKGASQDPQILKHLKEKYAEQKTVIHPIERRPEKTTQEVNQEKPKEASSNKLIKTASDDFPDSETLSLCISTLKTYMEDNKHNNLVPEIYVKLIQKLPSSRQVSKDMSEKECEILYETIEFLWRKITGNKIIPEKKIETAPESLSGNYWLMNNGILLQGINHYDIIKKNTQLISTLLNIGGMALQEYLSGHPDKLIWMIIKNGGVRLFITKDKRFYCQISPKTFGKWGKKKLKKYDFNKKVIKIIDLNAPFEGWKSGIPIVF